ncbi:MAG TPA: hypothetical protein VHT02_09935 [Methylocella sp.]|nr:hypothetical protein [Methylocella sp.]
MRIAVAHTMARANAICNTAPEIRAAMYLARANPVTGHDVADDAARAKLAIPAGFCLLEWPAEGETARLQGPGRGGL